MVKQTLVDVAHMLVSYLSLPEVGEVGLARPTFVRILLYLVVARLGDQVMRRRSFKRLQIAHGKNLLPKPCAR